MGCKVWEVTRIPAVAGSAGSATFEAGAFRSVMFENALAAPVFILWSQGAAAAGKYDAVCPGEAVRTLPVPDGASAISWAVAYPGAVPAGDAGLHCLIALAELNLGATVGPLNV